MAKIVKLIHDYVVERTSNNFGSNDLGIVGIHNVNVSVLINFSKKTSVFTFITISSP